MKTLLLSLLFLIPVCVHADAGAIIVKTAISQIGHDDQSSGCPNEGCYMGLGHNWCSEFVSWVYNKAGTPFSGGKSVDWLLNDTGKIIRWFRQNGIYVDRSDARWTNFAPAAGDYIFIGRADSQGNLTDRQHSGIVEFIDDSGTLHTIEGNNSQRPVARYTYPKFKINTQDNGPANGIVLGFGHRTGN